MQHPEQLLRFKCRPPKCKAVFEPRVCSALKWMGQPFSSPAERWFPKRQDTPRSPRRASGRAARGLDGTLPAERCHEAEVERAEETIRY